MQTKTFLVESLEGKVRNNSDILVSEKGKENPAFKVKRNQRSLEELVKEKISQFLSYQCH